jgi:hypothetical protein
LYILSSKRNNETTNILQVINNKIIFFFWPRGGLNPDPPVCTQLITSFLNLITSYYQSFDDLVAQTLQSKGISLNNCIGNSTDEPEICKNNT